MKLYLLLLLPFIIQTIVIGSDEWFFHIKRGLPKWERIGHPLDTLSVVLALIFALLSNLSPLNTKIYIGISIFSCLLVTKDEFVHKEVCPKKELWLHALLFLNHPLVLTAIYFLWLHKNGEILNGVPISYSKWALLVLAVSTILFALFQLIYWNLIRKEDEKKDQ